MNYNDYELKNLTVDQQLSMSSAFPVLMRKVYVWMTLALVITGFTAYGVATSPGVLQAIYGNQLLFWGMIIAEFALVIGVGAAINRLSLTTATLMFILYSVINGALLSYILPPRLLRCSLLLRGRLEQWHLSAIQPRPI